jgi:hypothetical protein
MKKILIVILFQICGNNLVVIQDNKPHMVCDVISQNCQDLGIVRLILIRQTFSCTKLSNFNVLE